MRKAAVVLAMSMLVGGVGNAQMKVNKPASRSPLKVQGAQTSAAAVRKITIDEAMKLMKDGNAVVVDVRSNESFTRGHIKGAVNIPGSQLLARLAELPPRKTIVAYCACSAEQSSIHAVQILAQHGVKNAVALQGGWHAWQTAGLPMAAGPK